MVEFIHRGLMLVILTVACADVIRGCEQHFVYSGQTSGILIHSDGFPYSQYSGNTDVCWLFEHRNINANIAISFKDFRTESCCDYVKVYKDDGRISDPLISSLSGRIEGSPSYTISGSRMTVTFVTDGSTEYIGWQACVCPGENPYCTCNWFVLQTSSNETDSAFFGAFQPMTVYIGGAAAVFVLCIIVSVTVYRCRARGRMRGRGGVPTHGMHGATQMRPVDTSSLPPEAYPRHNMLLQPAGNVPYPNPGAVGYSSAPAGYPTAGYPVPASAAPLVSGQAVYNPAPYPAQACPTAPYSAVTSQPPSYSEAQAINPTPDTKYHPTPDTQNHPTNNDTVHNDVVTANTSLTTSDNM